MKIVSFNANSLVNKLPEFHAFVKRESPDIIAICESFGRPDVDDCVFALKDYTLFRCDRPDSHVGGVLLYVRDSSHYSAAEYVLLDNICLFDDFVCVSVQFPDKCVAFCSVYRSPASTAVNNNRFLHVFKHIVDNFDDCVFVGDFNFPGVDWSSCTCKRDSNGFERQFVQMFVDLLCTQHVNECTHLHNGTLNSLLDLVITKSVDAIANVLPPLGKSDHVVVCCDYHACMPVNEPEKLSFKYDAANFDDWRHELSAVNWEAKYGTDQSDAAADWEDFRNLLLAGQDRFVPKRRKYNRKPPPPVLAALQRKHTTFMWYKQFQTDRNYRRYQAARDEVVRLSRRHVRDYERSVALGSKRNPKRFWSYVNSKRKSKSHIGPLQRPDGSKTDDSAEMANVLSDEFKSAMSPTVPDDELVPDLRPVPERPAMTEVRITLYGVRTALRLLNANKSAGPDGLHCRVLKELADVIALPIYLICRKSLSTGIIPDDWLTANVAPLLKKAPKRIAANYRPVSLTCVIAKICEKFVRDALQHHFESNGLFTDDQHGARRKRSCVTQLLSVLETLCSAVDDPNSHGIDAVYLDLKRAFDTVQIPYLTEKLRWYGVNGSLLTWITNFLTGRSQRVRVDGVYSDPVPLTSGVPQGTVTSPLLFLVFVNDAPDLIESLVKISVDDTKLLRKISDENDEATLQLDLNRIGDWARKWKLFFNELKCKVLRFGKRRNDVFPRYTLNSIEFEYAAEEKHLGVTFTDNLSPSTHCANIVAKARKVLAVMKYNFVYMEEAMFVPLYKSVVRPLLEYAAPVWSQYFAADIDLIESVQHRATRLVPGLWRLSYPERLRRLKLPTLLYRRLCGDLIHTYNLLHGRIAGDWRQFFTLASDTHGHSTRCHSLKLFKPALHRNLLPCKNSFAQRVLNTWNKLPDEVVTAPSIDIFKRTLDAAMPAIMDIYDDRPARTDIELRFTLDRYLLQ